MSKLIISIDHIWTCHEGLDNAQPETQKKTIKSFAGRAKSAIYGYIKSYTTL